MAVNATTSDPYAILGIPHDAAPATIRSSYKKLMLQCHPDKVHDESLRAEKALQFQKVQEAYELLTDSRRKRKYDEDLARNGGKPPAAAAPEATSPGTRKAGTTASAEAAAAAAAEQRARDKEKERSERHERRSRKEQERRSRGESSYGHDEREARRSYGSRYQQEPDARNAYESRYQEDTSRYTNAKYQEDARKYEARKSASSTTAHDQHKAFPQDSRPGYYETKQAEQLKLAELRRKMEEETSGGSSRRKGEEEMKQAERERMEAIRLEQERQKRERLEKERVASELRERTDIPLRRERRASASPPLRRGSGSTTGGGGSPKTSQSRTHVYGSSAPSNVPYTQPINVNASYSMPPRRHSVSSPSIEKQTSRLQSDVPCDSGYSSPVPETPLTEKKMPSPIMRGAQEGIDPRTASWKRYTFEVYVREDSTSPTPGSTPASPHHHRRKTASTTSPSQHPAEPLTAAPHFAAEIINKATGLDSMPYIYGSGPIDPRFTSVPSATSHVHTSPRPPHARHHSTRHHASPNTSPNMGSEGFSPRVQPIHTSPPTFHAHTHARRTDVPYPAFTRNPTY